MGFLDDLGKKVADAGQKTVQKTKEMSDIARLNSLVAKEESRLNQVYGRIGKLYVDLHADDFEDGFAGMFGEVREAQGNIQDYRQQIEEIRNARSNEENKVPASGKCPNCGAELLDGMRFCRSCGKPVPQPEEPSGAAEDKYCPGCGEKLAADALFCEKCGTKVS